MVDGHLETRIVEQDGPIAYLETTSLTRVFDEDANRCLPLAADERPTQTRKIITVMAEGYAGGEAVNVADVIQRHHALQRMLQHHKVIVPYAERLAEAFDHQRCEAQRAFSHVMSFIQSSAPSAPTATAHRR